MKEGTCTYLANPDTYCERISTLIQNGTDEWQNLWQLAIKELFHNSEVFQNPVNNINAINILLKVIEKAFKERVYRIRVQAFECWQYFIVTIDSCDVSDKLLNVLLIPLCASNHSVFEVLCAKLRTWATLLDSNLILRSTIMKKGIPNLLKILYGPHVLRQASEFDDLVEVCGNIYLKMLDKCKSYETNDLIMGSLERAIPVLTKTENTQNIAKLIWTNALDHICMNNWPASQFNYLIKTFQNLVSSQSAGSNALITSFLTVLIEIYGSFPVGYLKLNLALFCRCLFHVAENEILNLMERIMKKCQNENLFFNEIVKTWHACVEEYKNELHKYWFAAKTCFLSWEKHEEASTSTWVLLLPVEHLHSKWDAVILEEVRSTYEAVLPSDSDRFIKILCDDLTEFVTESENLPISLLISIIDLCKIVLQSPKRMDGVRHVKSVLLAVFTKIPSQEVLLTSTYKSFAPKFVATVLFFIREFPECASELAPITRMCNTFISSNEKDSSELPVVQLIKQLSSNEEANSESVLKPHNGVHVTPSSKPNYHLKTSFLSRLSSSIEKKKTNSEATAKLPSTPKSAKSTDEDVQFISIKPKPKNSPMTDHQKEMAKSRSYIPALYEDLSQSQSHSLPDSVSLLATKTPAPVISGIEYFDEDANSPPEQNNVRVEVENAPATVTISKHNTDSDREAVPASKKSLFKDTTNSDDPKTVRSDAGRSSRVNVESAETPNNENSSGKRRASRSVPAVESVDGKRVKRVSENVSNSRNTPSDPNSKSEEKKKRGPGRPRKSENLVEVQAVNLVENESQNVFVSTPIQLKKSTIVNSPLDSLMNVRNSEDGGKIRRKSLKLKSYELPTRSPVATRKRKSSIIPFLSPKKLCGSVDQSSTQNAGPSSAANGVGPVVDVDDVANNNTGSSSKIVSSAENNDSDGDVEDVQSSELNSSVIIIEPASNNEIISIIDSESQSVPEKPVDAKNGNSPNVPVVDDESTFFEDVEVSRNPENVCQPTREVPNEKATSSETGKPKKTTSSESFPEKLILEQSHAENDLQMCGQETSPTAELNVDSNATNVTNLPDKSDSLLTKTISSPTKNRNKTSPNKNEEISGNESPSPVRSSEKAESPSDLANTSVKKKLIDEITEKGETQYANADQTKSNTSPLSNNTRTLKIMKMARDPQNLSKHKQFAKMSKSPLCSSPCPSNSRITSTNQRTMKILMANNGSIEKPRTSPTKVVPTPTERLKYYPKECTSPGILKKPDLNGSISSPKSAKFVNFAEQLTATRTFDVCEENYYDSYSSDDASNSNLINDDEATSQEVLYSPLLNCSEDVKHIIDRLSLGKAAVDLFHRMGIRTVGHLASISTLTAKSIPAGDNRLHRLRKALKEYDECRTSFYESKGLRIPSARRRILCCKSSDSILEISSLIELLDEAESIDPPPVEPVSPEVVPSSSSGSPSNNVAYPTNRMPTVVLAKLSEQNCPSLLNKNEIIVRLEEQSSPTKTTKPAADVSRSPTKADCAAATSPTKSPSASPTKIASDSPTKVSSTSPTKVWPTSPTKVSSASPTKVSSASPTKVFSASPAKESAAGKAAADVSPVRGSGSPRKSLLQSFECEGLKSPPLGVEKTSAPAVETAAAVAEDTTSGAGAVYAAAEPSVVDLIEELDNDVEGSREQDAIEDTDLIYTQSVESNAARSQQNAETQARRSDKCAVSLRSPRVIDVEEQAAPSPEIVDVDADDHRRARRADDAAEKESSLPIFSPDVTSRTVNRQPAESQSPIDASKSQCEERSLFTSDETAAPAVVDLVADEEEEDARTAATPPEGLFSRLLASLWEPFLTERLRRTLIVDERSAFAEYAEIMRENVAQLRRAREAGAIGADALEACGLGDLPTE